MANKRRRKKQIVSLEGPDGVVNDTEGMIGIAVNYYKQLFGSENMMDINLSSDFWNPSELVSEAHNSELDQEFQRKRLRLQSLALMLRVHLALMGSLFSFIRSSGI
jgi:hypothetical protein